MIKAVVFDLDGVLADTERLKAQAHVRSAVQLGGVLPDDFYPRVLGRSQDEVARLAIEAAHLAVTVEGYNAVFTQQYAPTEAEAVPGAMETIRGVRRHGYRMALVTSNPEPAMRVVVERLGISSFLDETVSADDVASPKPAPDCYRLALDRLGISPGDALAVEDTDSGGSAARGAGILAVGCRHELAKFQSFEFAVAVLSLPLSSAALLDVIRRVDRAEGEQST